MTSLLADEGLARAVEEFSSRSGAGAPSVEEVRRGGEARAAAREPGPPPVAVDDVEAPGAGRAPAFAVRVHRPVLVPARGGGWTVGSTATHDRTCRRLADRTAEHDPLRDQGEGFAARLREAGVQVLVRWEGRLVHSFRMDASPPPPVRPRVTGSRTTSR